MNVPNEEHITIFSMREKKIRFKLNETNYSSRMNRREHNKRNVASERDESRQHAGIEFHVEFPCAFNFSKSWTENNHNDI